MVHAVRALAGRWQASGRLRGGCLGCVPDSILLSSKLPQHPPARHESLNSDGWWKNPFLEGAFSIRGLVNSLHAVITQHRQLPSEFCQLLTVEDGFGFGAACHRILTEFRRLFAIGKNEGILMYYFVTSQPSVQEDT